MDGNFLSNTIMEIFTQPKTIKPMVSKHWMGDRGDSNPQKLPIL